MPVGSVSGGSSTVTPSDALAGLAKIREQIEALRKEQQARQSDPSRDELKAPPATVTQGRTLKEYLRYSNDTTTDTLWTARDIGVLVKNNSRLNVITSLREGDTVDHFRFRVHRQGEMRLGQIIVPDGDAAKPAKDDAGEGAPELRIQLMDRRGRIVADSGAASGSDRKKAFERLENGTLSVRSGDYFLKITRPEGELPQHAKGKDKAINYGLQLTMGTYHNDFDTIERAPARGQDPYALPVRAQAVIDSLSAGIGLIASLPPIGQSGTQKLMGHFIDRMF